MSSAPLRVRILAVSISLLSFNSLAISANASSSKNKTAPTGTLLIPLSPRMDDGNNLAPSLAPVVTLPPPRPRKQAAPVRAPRQIASKTVTPSQTAAVSPAAVSADTTSGAGDTDLNFAVQKLAPTDDLALPLTDPSTSGEPAIHGEALDPIIDENALLKGTVQIVADDTEYDQEKNTFLGTGNAVAIIAGQNSKLEADTILYDQNTQTIDARGNVKILRDGQLTTGSSFKFQIDSDEYLITNPDTELQGTQVIARVAKGDKDGLAFKNGEFTLPKPFHISNNPFYGPLSFTERAQEERLHPDAYLPEKQSFKFTARKMVYEKYKDAGNLTVFGGRMKFDRFTIALPKFTATASENTRVVFPVTPIIGNNFNVGGINIGPSFNYGVGKTGIFSWAPLVQIGGRSVYDTTAQTNRGKLGAGFRLGYTSDKLSTHLAYGSVSNLVVGDFKYKFNQHTLFQSGINRFLNDGLFGMRRARLAAEAVDVRTLSNVPYMAMLSFRTSAGAFQDQPQLVQLQGSQYSQLFNTQGKTVRTGAFRLEEQFTAMTHPLFSLGNEKYGAKMNIFAGAALRGYSTGDAMAMGQFGPMLSFKANKARAQIGYTQSGVSGKSPFVFDQFIQGNRSVSFAGDVKVAKWLTLGTNLGYNLVGKMMYQRGFTAAIGPEDLKVLISRDTISGINRFGFNLLYGQPVSFNKLIMKGAPDAGQLGGI